MEYLTGILLDVSGSMRHNIGKGTDEKGGPWARSIFEVIDNLIKGDISPNNHVFAIGVGASVGEEIFDIIGALKQIQDQSKQTEQNKQANNTETVYQGPATPCHISMIFSMLEDAGARTIRKWASGEDVSRTLTDDKAVLLLKKFESDKSFLKKFVQEFLPPACRFFDSAPDFLSTVASALNVRATVEDIRAVINRATPFLVDERKEKEEPNLLEEKKKTVGVTLDSIFNVQEASDVLHGYVDEKELTSERSLELLQSVEPYIYGTTPLYQAIEKAIELFEKKASNFHSAQKLLFILSDGDATDEDLSDPARKDRAVSKLTTAGVTVVSCFITKSFQIEPKRLFSKMKPDWDRGAKFLFSLSSKVSTQSLPRTMFVKRDWTIDIANNETHLFLQVNHPDHLREGCEVARNVVCCQDALCDMLASVNIDFYINQEVKDCKAKLQEGDTCAANAAATVLHLSMTRIRGREGGCPDFCTLRDEIVKQFDVEKYPKGVPTIHVLQKMCPKYRLRCNRVDYKGAMKAVASSRPVVATFRLTEKEWDKFEDFYESNPKGILTKKEIDITARRPKTPDFGHAVVLTSFDSECLRLLNSGGDKWGDMGFFRVQKADVLGLQFIDVFWKEDDLKEEEKTYLKKFGSINAGILMELLPSLKDAEYTCPIAECSKRSPVVDFTGTLSQVKCPKCGKEFSTNNAQEGNILALNIYLTSLIR